MKYFRKFFAVFLFALFANFAISAETIIKNNEGVLSDGNFIIKSFSIASGDKFSFSDFFTVSSTGPALNFGGDGLWHYNKFSWIVQGGQFTYAALKTDDGELVATGNLTSTFGDVKNSSFSIVALGLVPGDTYELVFEGVSLSDAIGNSNISFQALLSENAVSSVDEPNSYPLLMFGLGVVGLGTISWRRTRSSKP